MIPNSAKATNPSVATRTASCGEIGERRSWTGSYHARESGDSPPVV